MDIIILLKRERASERVTDVSSAKDKLTARYWACKDLWGGPGGDTQKPPKSKKSRSKRRKSRSKPRGKSKRRKSRSKSRV